MGSWVSRPAWDVWLIRRRYRFNEIQVRHEYLGVPGCFGARDRNAMQTMNQLYMQMLAREHVKLTSLKENKETKLKKLRKGLKEMVETESQHYTVTNEAQAKRLKTDKAFIAFVTRYFKKVMEVEKQTKSLEVTAGRIEANETAMTSCVDYDALCDEAEELPDWGKHCAAINGALETKINVISNPASEGAVAKLNANLEEIQGGQGMSTSVEITESMISKVIEVMFDKNARDKEFADVEEPRAVSSGSRKASRPFSSAIMEPAGEGNDGEDTLMFHLDSTRATGSGIGRGQNRSGSGFKTSDF